MRKRSQPPNGLPEVNLIPMLDVLMSVLTFFIIISMTLTGEQIVGVTLPTGTTDDEGAPTEEEAPDPLVVGLTKDGVTVIRMEPLSAEELSQRIQSYLAEYPEGTIVLKADQELPYEEVLVVLRQLRDIGGDRVGLATRAN